MNKNKIKKIYLIVLAAYVALVTSFYFLAGEQLWFTEAEEKIKMMSATSVSDEVNIDNIVTQTFVSEVDRINQIEMVFTKGYKEGNGTVVVRILDGRKVVASLREDVVNIPEQHRVYIVPDEPIDDAYGKEFTISIFSTSKIGKGLFVMMNDTKLDSKVTCREFSSGNQSSKVGTMCFAVVGSNKISLAPYYWLIVSCGGVLLAIVLFISYRKSLVGKEDYLIAGLNAIEKYKFLISQLVSRDFKSKYKRSVFGIFWSFLNPLLTMTVQFLVFSTLFKADTRTYPIYLLSGVICFNFFKECSDQCLSSLTGNANLITKVYIPKYIFPLSKALSSIVNLGFSIILLLISLVVMRVGFYKSTILGLYFLVCLILFAFGVGLFLSALMVFFRDVQFLWSVVTQIWHYATPIFYTAEIIPEKFRFIVRFNPLYHFIGNFRKCVMDGISPSPTAYLYCLLFAILSLAIGTYVFKKTQDRFTLYL